MMAAMTTCALVEKRARISGSTGSWEVIERHDHAAGRPVGRRAHLARRHLDVEGVGRPLEKQRRDRPLGGLAVAAVEPVGPAVA
jgi:hypothetical protein